MRVAFMVEIINARAALAEHFRIRNDLEERYVDVKEWSSLLDRPRNTFCLETRFIWKFFDIKLDQNIYYQTGERRGRSQRTR